MKREPEEKVMDGEDYPKHGPNSSNGGGGGRGGGGGGRRPLQVGTKSRKSLIRII